METSLHRDLKTLYAGQDAQFEVSLSGYRIDVMSGGHLVERRRQPWQNRPKVKSSGTLRYPATNCKWLQTTPEFCEEYGYFVGQRGSGGSRK